MSVTAVIKQGERVCKAQAQQGQSVLSLLVSAGFSAEAPCGGHGICKKCLCTARGGVSAEGEVLACRTFITGDCEITLPEKAALLSETEQSDRLDADREVPPGALGFAVDIGTTTLAVSLYDMTTGRRLGSAGGENPQRAFGGDVMTRIEACMKQEKNRALLTVGVRREILALCEKLLHENGAGEERVRRLAVCGNTVMLHLFAGLSPVSLGVAPYTPLSLFDTELPAPAVGFPFEATVHILPCIGSFIGADCAAGMLAEEFDEGHTPLLLADVGTNGELMLRTKEKILCASAAAGPAFEGAGIACGMCALAGAISEVSLQGGQVHITTVEGAPAAGICGSGLLSLLSELLREGIADKTGRLLPPGECPGAYSRYIAETAGEVRFILVPGVYIGEADIRNLQLAKAAVCAAAEVLLERGGLSPEKTEDFRLAGGFGARLDEKAAERIGLFPKELLKQAKSVGNAAARGCARTLLSAACQKRLTALCKNAVEIPLAADGEFSDRFMKNITF